MISRPASPPERRLDRWLAGAFGPVVGIALGAVLALASIPLGFFADDDLLLSFLDKQTPFSRPWYDLYRFAPSGAAESAKALALGQMPWWSAPGLRIHLVRPLTSALLALDHSVFAGSPLGYHVHSIAWWLLLLVAVRALFRRLLPAPTASLALVVFAASGAAIFPYAWISARHCLVSAAAATLALVAAVRAREEAWRPGRWLAPLGMVVGLAGGESALGGLAFWFCYELAGPARPQAWTRRALHAATPVAIGLAYLALYAAEQGGARNSGGYLDPASPVAFALGASHRYPALLAAAFFGFPAEFASVLPTLPFVVLALVGGAGVWLLLRACRPFLEERERAAMRWLVPGALLTLCGFVGGFPGSRELLLPNLAWCPLVAILVRHGFRAGVASGAALASRRAAMALVVLIHLVLAPVAALASTANNVKMAGLIDATTREPPLSDLPPNARMLVIDASDPMGLVYPILHLVREGRVAPGACVALLTAVKADVRVTRTDAATLVIEPVGGSLLRGAFETLYRADGLPFHVGDEVRTCDADVRVLATDDDGKPTRIQARLANATLDDPHVRIAAWKDGALRTLHFTVGETQEIRWTHGPMTFL